MNKIVATVIFTFSMVLIQSISIAQTTKEEDTTKVSTGKKVERNKVNTIQSKDGDTTQQHKITVNDDGVTSKRKVKNKIKAAKNEENKEESNKKADPKTTEPKKEE